MSLVSPTRVPPGCCPPSVPTFLHLMLRDQVPPSLRLAFPGGAHAHFGIVTPLIQWEHLGRKSPESGPLEHRPPVAGPGHGLDYSWSA
jgi:hypothetical protein